MNVKAIEIPKEYEFESNTLTLCGFKRAQGKEKTMQLKF